jgi:hypothetical protein
MSQIDILKKQLEDAEKEEKLKYLLKELSDVKSEYEGKSFGSHTFDRKHSANVMGAIQYEKFFIKEDKIYVLERSIHASKFNAVYKPSKTDINYSRHYYERCLTDGERSASYNLYSGYTHFRKEISNEIFEQLWNGTEECHLVVKGLFNSKLPEIKMEWISQGDHRNEETVESAIKTLDLDIIDFKLFPKVHNCIEYHTLPMFQDRRWLPRIYAKTILEYHIKNLKKRQADSFTPGRIVNALQHEIDTVTNFIKTEL